MTHLINAAQREVIMRRRVYTNAVRRGSMTEKEADTGIADMQAIAELLSDFNDRVAPLADFVRRIHPDIKDEENLLTIPAEPRLNLTVGQLRRIVGLYARNADTPTQGQLL